MVVVSDQMVQELLDSFVVTDTQFKLVGISNVVKHQRISWVLFEAILEADKGKLSRQLRSLRYSFPPGFMGMAFPNPILREAKDRQIKSVAELKEIAFNHLSKIKLEPEKEFLFRFPANFLFEGKDLDLKNKHAQVRVKHFSDYPDISANPKNDETNRSPLKTSWSSNDFVSYSVIEIQVHARNRIFAENLAKWYLNFILGVVSFVLKQGSFSLIPDKGEREILDLRYGFCFTFEDGIFGDFITGNFTGNPPKVYDLRADNRDELIQIFNKFQSTSSSIQEVLLDAFSWYLEGMTQKLPGFSFLFFWSSIERLCLKEAGIPETRVKRILSSIFESITDLERMEIERLYKIRNTTVHNAGYSAVTDYDRDIVRWYNENLLSFFVWSLTEYTPVEIQDLYDYLCLDVTQFKRKQRMMQIVDKMSKENQDTSENNKAGDA